MLLVIFSSQAYAQTCDVDNVKDVLKRNLYLFFTESSSPLTLNEVRDLLSFYLSIDAGLITVDCSPTGSLSSTSISNIVNSGENATDTVPTCADGTKYGECSSLKPKYCYSGSLLHRCNYCGCPSGNTCGSDGKCALTAQTITCSSDLDCGTSGFVGSYSCSNNYVTRTYQNISCQNPGTTSSSCVTSSYFVNLNYCDPALNKICVEGSSDCQTNVTNVTITCSDGTQNNQCSTTKPKYCSNGNLVENCGLCGCQTGKTCSATGACVNQTTAGTCSWTADGVCPSNCAAGSDADCCTNAGKYVLTANLTGVCQQACYSSTYTTGTTPCLGCSASSDGACPNWCAAGSDADCCTNAGKCWRPGQGCYDTC